MRDLCAFLIALVVFLPVKGWTQVGADSAVKFWELTLEPASAGLRFDNNVYRSASESSRLSDGIVSGDWGGMFKTDYDVFHLHLGYHLGDDQYLTHTDLNNLRNDADVLAAIEPNDWSIYYKYECFVRNSQNEDFNYFDINSVAGVRWTPAGYWTIETQYKNLARQYYDLDPAIWSRNFLDQSGSLSLQREFSERFSLKLFGSYTNRQFNRYAVQYDGTTLYSLGDLQNDNTWKVLLNAHMFFATILQDVNVEGQRTDSNSYGFSNWVESFSWAGVVRPVSGFYLELFFRLYLKTYDVSPLNLPDLQLGFIDEDSQDLLAAKGNWDLGAGWVGNLAVSRIRSESDQPGAFYIKDIISAQIRRNF